MNADERRSRMCSVSSNPWRIHDAAIYGSIYHQYSPNVRIYTSTMDPMGNGSSPKWIVDSRKSFYWYNWYWQFIPLSKNWVDRTNANIEKKMRGASSHHKRIHIEYRSPTANGFTSNNWDSNQQIITRKKGFNSVALGLSSQHYKTTLNGINK